MKEDMLKARDVLANNIDALIRKFEREMGLQVKSIKVTHHDEPEYQDTYGRLDEVKIVVGLQD